MGSNISQMQALAVAVEKGAIDGFVLSQIDQGIIPGHVDLLPAVAVTGDGYPIRVTWSPVYGAMRAEVTSAVVRIGVAVVNEQLGELHLVKAGPAYVVTVPSGRRIASLTLQGMKDVGGNAITSQSSLPMNPERHRLVVQTQQGSRAAAPIHTVPAVEERGMIPASLGGARFSNGVLSLPNVLASKLRLSLVIKSFPEEFQEQSFVLGRVFGNAAVYPTDLQLVDAAGAVLWAFPGEYPPSNPPFEFDLRVNLDSALNAALAARPDQPLDVIFRLKGKSPSQAGFWFAGAEGALVRDFPDTPVMSVALEGDPVALPIDGRLADEVPSSATADLTVRYSGIRILEELSDSLPRGVIGGFTVGHQLVTRAYLPEALTALTLARVGVIGRAAAPDCELAVQLVTMNGDVPGDPLGAPTVTQVAATNEMRTHWITLPPGIDLSRGNIGITARANRGRFFWAGDGTRPLVKLAVYDPSPGGRPLRLNGTQVHAVVTAEETHMPALLFPPALFRSVPPTFESPLFLTVDVSDLALRYAR